MLFMVLLCANVAEKKKKKEEEDVITLLELLFK
jgi:hypothetical protein